jgi:hypothetical protein
MDTKKLFATEAQTKQADLKKSLEKYGRKATGKTIAAIRSESNDNGFEVYGPKHVYTLVYGRKPTGPGASSEGRPLIEAIKEWIAAKGLNLNPYAVTAKIHKQGTKLYIDIKRGGQPSKVLEDVFGDKYTDELQGKVYNQLNTLLRNTITSSNSEIQKF